MYGVRFVIANKYYKESEKTFINEEDAEEYGKEQLKIKENNYTEYNVHEIIKRILKKTNHAFRLINKRKTKSKIIHRRKKTGNGFNVMNYIKKQRKGNW